jgi:hypothetical protein
VQRTREFDVSGYNRPTLEPRIRKRTEVDCESHGKLRREVPDTELRDDDEPELLVAPEDENVDDAADNEKDLIGRGVDPGADGLSAAKAAVRVGDEG